MTLLPEPDSPTIATQRPGVEVEADSAHHIPAHAVGSEGDGQVAHPQTRARPVQVAEVEVLALGEIDRAHFSPFSRPACR